MRQRKFKINNIKNSKVIQILQYLKQHPAKKVKILEDVLGKEQLEGKELRGYYSSTFARLRKKHLIDYYAPTREIELTVLGASELGRMLRKQAEEA